MLSDVIKGLKTTGLPVTYGSWQAGQVPALPYLVVRETDPDVVYGDDGHLYTARNYTIEMYFEKKDPPKETKVESFLDAYGPWSVGEDIYIDTDRMYERDYFLQDKGD
jgi:hypothetical protein